MPKAPNFGVWLLGLQPAERGAFGHNEGVACGATLLRGLYPACCPNEPAWGILYLFPSRWFRVNQATETRAVRVLGGMKGLAPGQGPGCRAGL